MVDPRWVKPLDAALVELAAAHRLVVDRRGQRPGRRRRRRGARLLRDADVDVPVRGYGIPQRFLDHAKRAEILGEIGLTGQDLAREISRGDRQRSSRSSSSVPRRAERAELDACGTGMITEGGGKTLDVDIFRTKSVEQSIARHRRARAPAAQATRPPSTSPSSASASSSAPASSCSPARGRGATAGPAVALSFVVAGIVCALAALCYAEFASTVPVAGSAYTFS